MAIANDLYHSCLIDLDVDCILEYEWAIIQILNNCDVRTSMTWNDRLNILDSIKREKNKKESLNRFNKYINMYRKHVSSKKEKLFYYDYIQVPDK